MDNNQLPQQNTVFQPQPVTSLPTKKRVPVLVWLLVATLVLISAGLGVLYANSAKQLSDAKELRIAVEKRLNSTELTLKEAQTKLKTASFLPNKNAMSPQCYSGSNDQTKLAPVNTTPIDGYNVYLVNCVTELVNGRSSGKVIAFKVDAKGDQKFVFGAGSGEPYCVSGKILPATAASNISQQTGLPVCKTF